MSSQEPPQEIGPPLKLLSLDGGGIRGLSSLIILKYLMKRVNPQNPPKPCEYFDLIGGTSTGGLIAIMLGRLRMDVDACISKYLELSSAAFQPKRAKAHFFGKAKDLWKADGAYRSDCLATEFRNVAKALEGDEQAKLTHPNTDCRVFVCAFTKALNTPVRLRSYVTEDSVDTLAGSDCTIWEAARATSAAATFFDPIQIGRQRFVDGATGFNNPVEVVLEEAVSIWPNATPRIQCLVSIGTGMQEIKDFGDNLKEVIETLKAIATETEETERRFFKVHKALGVGDRYFRFNVDRGLSGIELDEHQKIDKIEVGTESFLGDPRIKEVVKTFVTAHAPVNSPVDAGMKENYLRWLPYMDPLEYHNIARRYRTTKSTGLWFLRGEFERWKMQPRSLLWLCAKAGSGKTILTSAVVDEIEQQHLGTLAYFYFSFDSKDRQGLRHFKYSILIQVVRNLIRKDPKLFDRYHVPIAFRGLYDVYQPSRNPKEEDLSATLVSLLNESKETYVVVDALDECSSPTDVVSFLAEISRITLSKEDIEVAIGDIPNTKRIVPFDIAIVNVDIRHHLQDRMARDPYKGWKDDLKDKVVNHLTELADGVFRWADLQIVDLGRKAREKDVDRALKKLPKTLGETYERILRRIDEDYMDEALAILRWLAYSRRPLLLREAAEIIAFDTVKDESSSEPENYAVSFSPDNRFNGVSWVRHILSGLVTVSGIDDRLSSPDEVGNVSGDERDGVISFAHFSVKEYLESASVYPQHFRLIDKSCQQFIFKSCLAYLRYYDTKWSDDFLNLDMDIYPLLLYAWKNWPYHASVLLSGMDHGSIEALFGELTNVNGTAWLLSTSAALHGSLRDQVPREFNINQDLARALRRLLEGSKYEQYFTVPDVSDSELALYRWVPSDYYFTDPDVLDSQMFLGLWVASSTGRIELVKLLRDSGLDVNEKLHKEKWGKHSRDGWTPLHSAAEGGHEKVVWLLLIMGADVNAEFICGDTEINTVTALSLAKGHGHTELAQLLLEKGAVTKWEVPKGGVTPLHVAAAEGHDTVVRQLLESGADINRVAWTSKYNVDYDSCYGDELAEFSDEYVNAGGDNGSAGSSDLD